MNKRIDDFRKKFNKELKTGLLSMLVLLTIDRDGGPCYGYRIIKILERTSDGRLRFPEGTIYPILSSLSAKELLESYWGDPQGGPRRKYYRLTQDGREALALCLEDWLSNYKITREVMEKLGVTR